MRRNHSVNIFLTLIILSVFCFRHSTISAQSGNGKTLATVGSIEISESEFLERYELSPQFKRHIISLTPSVKLEFLYSIIAEKLWALEAENINVDTIGTYQTAINSIRKLYARDALFKQEIKNKVSVTEEEVISGIIKNANRLHVNFVFSEDSTEIKELYGLLNNGMPFDTLLATRPEYYEQPVPIQIEFGLMEKHIEDSLYALTVGEYTAPMFTPDGWYIFYLDKKEEIVIDAALTNRDLRKLAHDKIEDRKINDRYKVFFKNFFEGKEVKTNGILFASLGSKVLDVFKAKAPAKSEEDLIHLSAEDVMNIKAELGQDTLDMVFIRLEDKPVTLEQFFDEIVFEGVYTKYVNERQFTTFFNQTVKQFIERELLAQEAFDRGLDKLPEVEYYVNMWKDNYRYQALQKKYQSELEVSDSLAYEYYREQYLQSDTSEVYKIVEVLTNDLEVIDHVLSELEKGADIKELAYQYSIRESAKADSGEYDYFTAGMHGRIGRAATQLEVGEVYGPLNLPDGYSVIKLTGKKTETGTPAENFDDIKAQIKETIKQQTTFRKIIDKTVELANKYDIKINGGVLNGVKVSNVNFFAFRLMGFGGKITAVPVLAPFTEWVDRWLKSKQDLP